MDAGKTVRYKLSSLEKAGMTMRFEVIISSHLHCPTTSPRITRSIDLGSKQRINLADFVSIPDWFTKVFYPTLRLHQGEAGAFDLLIAPIYLPVAAKDLCVLLQESIAIVLVNFLAARFVIETFDGKRLPAFLRCCEYGLALRDFRSAAINLHPCIHPGGYFFPTTIGDLAADYVVQMVECRIEEAMAFKGKQSRW